MKVFRQPHQKTAMIVFVTVNLKPFRAVIVSAKLLRVRLGSFFIANAKLTDAN